MLQTGERTEAVRLDLRSETRCAELDAFGLSSGQLHLRAGAQKEGVRESKRCRGRWPSRGRILRERTYRLEAGQADKRLLSRLATVLSLWPRAD